MEVNKETTQTNESISEATRKAILDANAAWRDSSLYISIQEGDEMTLKFCPDVEDGILVKQDSFQGRPSGYKTFYQVKDVNSTNDNLRTFKANRR